MRENQEFPVDFVGTFLKYNASVATIDAQNVWDCNYKCTRQAGFWGVSEDFSAGSVVGSGI